MPQQTLNFISFHHDIVTFKASHDISELRFPALEPHNLQIIASLCRRLDDALKGELYTADELPVLIVANQLRKRADVIPTISELETMKKGAAIVVRHSVRKGLIADLDNTDSSSVFATAERMAKALLQSEKIEEVKKAWQARSALAMYPMQALHEMTVSLNQLENYISLLRKDFDFSNANQLAIYYKKYVTNMTDAKLAELDSFVNALQTKISTLRDMIAQSMLERLRLLPTSVLENPDSLPNGVRDDLIHTSLKELVATKVVSKNYLSNYELQTSSATCLTSDDVRRACNYIHELQDATLQAELSKLYITRTHAIATDNAYSADDHNDNVILIPTAIPGHYHANVQPNFNQGKWDFIFITTDSNSPKTVKMSGLKRGDLDDSSPGMSFFDMKDNSRVVISTVEAYLEVPLENNSLPQLCELILEKDYPADTHDDGFYYLVDDREDQALLAFAAKHFKSNKNASFFIDHIKQHLPLNNGMSLERFCDEQLKFMYQELQKDCLANLDASLFSGFGLTHGQCSQIFTALERKYFAGEFADTKVDEIVNVVEQIINEVAAPGHKSRLPMFVVEDADCRAYYQTNILINLQKKKLRFKKFRFSNRAS